MTDYFPNSKLSSSPSKSAPSCLSAVDGFTSKSSAAAAAVASAASPLSSSSPLTALIASLPTSILNAQLKLNAPICETMMRYYLLTNRPQLAWRIMEKYFLVSVNSKSETASVKHPELLPTPQGMKLFPLIIAINSSSSQSSSSSPSFSTSSSSSSLLGVNVLMLTWQFWRRDPLSSELQSQVFRQLNRENQGEMERVADSSNVVDIFLKLISSSSSSSSSSASASASSSSKQQPRVSYVPSLPDWTNQLLTQAARCSNFGMMTNVLDCHQLLSVSSSTTSSVSSAVSSSIGFIPDLKMLHSMLEAATEQGNLKATAQIIATMTKLSSLPSTTSSSSSSPSSSSLSSSSSSPSSSSTSTSTSFTHLKPTGHTWTLVVRCYLKAGKLAMALSVWKKMLTSLPQPDGRLLPADQTSLTISLHLLLRSFCKHMHLNAALMIFARLQGVAGKFILPTVEALEKLDSQIILKSLSSFSLSSSASSSSSTSSISLSSSSESSSAAASSSALLPSFLKPHQLEFEFRHFFRNATFAAYGARTPKALSGLSASCASKSSASSSSSPPSSSSSFLSEMPSLSMSAKDKHELLNKSLHRAFVTNLSNSIFDSSASSSQSSSFEATNDIVIPSTPPHHLSDFAKLLPILQSLPATIPISPDLEVFKIILRNCAFAERMNDASAIIEGPLLLAVFDPKIYAQQTRAMQRRARKQSMMPGNLNLDGMAAGGGMNDGTNPMMAMMMSGDGRNGNGDAGDDGDDDESTRTAKWWKRFGNQAESMKIKSSSTLSSSTSSSPSLSSSSSSSSSSSEISLPQLRPRNAGFVADILPQLAFHGYLRELDTCLFLLMHHRLGMSRGAALKIIRARLRADDLTGAKSLKDRLTHDFHVQFNPRDRKIMQQDLARVLDNQMTQKYVASMSDEERDAMERAAEEQMRESGQAGFDENGHGDEEEGVNEELDDDEDGVDEDGDGNQEMEQMQRGFGSEEFSQHHQAHQQQSYSSSLRSSKRPL